MLDASRPLDRRAFLADMGRGAFAIAIVTITGCGPTALATAAPGPSPRPTSGAGATPGSSPSDSGASPGPAGSPTGASSPPGGGEGVSWAQVNLGFVNAYVLVRGGGEAAVVDTGVSGSEDEIEASLDRLGVGWSSVAHVILTHRHNDHIGSAPAVLQRAPDATVYAGAGDLAAISLPRPVTAVGRGDTVFDRKVFNTPGHTPGSISVLDPVGGVLLAGDAMGAMGGKPALPGAQFTEDMTLAKQSIAKLGGLTFDTLLIGHGDPIVSDASTLVQELAASG